ncbi:hypothetical protein T12_11687 [Trichinella patagoniensis]|uniref:Uncharacterized protein n=1 Tax=Trichinella patagoniensis TaxID=990121 RepID=A0A0V0X213_9BILA|nr:hypothetical protein T12_11687 [Trichinella patagoniensis]
MAPDPCRLRSGCRHRDSSGCLTCQAAFLLMRETCS